MVPLPFTNQASSKKRPAVIVSSEAYNRAKPDMVVMAITSQLRPGPALGEVWISQWQAAGLIKPSAIKPVNSAVSWSRSSWRSSTRYRMFIKGPLGLRAT